MLVTCPLPDVCELFLELSPFSSKELPFTTRQTFNICFIVCIWLIETLYLEFDQKLLYLLRYHTRPFTGSFMRMLEFADPEPRTDPAMMFVRVEGNNLLCGGPDGLRFYIKNSAGPDTNISQPGTPTCNMEVMVKMCRVVPPSMTTSCQYECDCPVSTGGCGAALLRWDRRHLVSEADGLICEVILD